MSTVFTADQLDAIDVAKRHLDACVVAGPGSGKTTVLVEYFRRLVAEGVDPLRILAITFTEKAAGNMRKKLAEKFHDQPAIRARLERAWVSTIHGFCARLLRENAVFAGVDPEFYVADERESWRLQQEAVTAAVEEMFQADPAGVRGLIRGLVAIDFEEAVLSAYDGMRGAGMRIHELAALPAPTGGPDLPGAARVLRELRTEPVTNWSYAQKQHLDEILEGAERIVSAETPLEALRAIEAFPANLQKCKRGTGAYNLIKHFRDEVLKPLKYTLITHHYAPQRAILLDILTRFDRLYRDRKRSSGALDFADLEEFTVRLLEDNPGTRARLQQQFDHILMDEFQDTNGQQAKLLKLVRPPDRFYAVGDINQSIFGFRHAEPDGFSQYRDEIERNGSHLVNLIDNFRSRAQVLSAVETVVAGLPGIEPRPLVPGRKFDAERPVCVEVLAIPTDEQALRTEAQCVASRILELTTPGSGFEFKDVAVLVRNTEVLGEFGGAFDDAGIPYLVNRGKGFYESREVNDLTHLLRVIANPRDEISLAAVLRSPLVAASDEALLRLRVLGLEIPGDNIGAALLRITAAECSPEDFARLSRFRDRLRVWRIRREYVTFDRILLDAIDDCGYRPEPGGRGAANIDKFLSQARDASSRMPLDEFVQELAWVRDSNPREADAPPEDSANAVKVMTVHSAKGLEFPVVFVAAIHKGVETDPPVVAFSPRIGLGARWRNPAIREEKDDVFQHAIREERRIREKQEGHRLLYVAMTRAEEHLVLSFSGKKQREWAEVVVNSLQLDPGYPLDEVLTRTAPDGKTWNLRLLVTDRAPELLVRPRAAEAAAETAYLAFPAVTEQQDANATVTAIAKFAKCPREYYLAHYLGFEGRARQFEEAAENGPDPADEVPALAAGDFGTQVHQLLAGTPVPNPGPEALRLAEVFHRSALGRRLSRATRIEREFDFLMAVEDLVIRGQIDLWFEEGGELVIVDYKTDAVTGMEAHQRAQEYALQLRLYAIAVERAAGRPPDRAWLHFLRPNTVIEVDISPSLVESPEAIVRDFQEAQSSLQFPLNEREHCRRCQFYLGLCPSTYGGKS